MSMVSGSVAATHSRLSTLYYLVGSQYTKAPAHRGYPITGP